MAEMTAGSAGTANVRGHYMALVRRRRLYGGLTLLVFAMLLISGFGVADARNAGGFWDGWRNMLDFPADVLTEAWQKRAELPGLILRYLPDLVGRR